jgi:hypothetical protein
MKCIAATGALQERGRNPAQPRGTEVRKKLAEEEERGKKVGAEPLRAARRDAPNHSAHVWRQCEKDDAVQRRMKWLPCAAAPSACAREEKRGRRSGHMRETASHAGRWNLCSDGSRSFIVPTFQCCWCSSPPPALCALLAEQSQRPCDPVAERFPEL